MRNLGRVAAVAAVLGFTVLGIASASCSGDDAAAPSSGTDATTDVGRKEAASLDEDSSVACTAALPAGYTPGPFVPPVTTNTACTSTQVQAYYDNCFSSTASSSTCTPFRSDAGNAACVSCMETPVTASKYGAVLALSNNTALANISGCMAIIDGDLSNTGCGAKVQAAALCNDAACSANCPIDSSSSSSLNSSFKAYNACEQAAAAGVCATENEAATTCQNDSRYAACKGASFEAYMVQIGNIICASGNATDGGSDASDASDDAADADDDASDAADD